MVFHPVEREIWLQPFLASASASRAVARRQLAQRRLSASSRPPKCVVGAQRAADFHRFENARP